MLELPATYAATHAALHRVATHVLARRRVALVGRFGLRWSPDGIAMPPSGADHEVLRTSGSLLVREWAGAAARTTSIDLATATLAEAAAFAEVDLSGPLDVGHDTPAAGDPDVPLAVDALAGAVLGRWLAFAWPVLDRFVAGLGAAGEPNVVQLWPEHFDAGADVALGAGRASVGASTGDHHVPSPYLYVAPWGDRSDDPFWNAPFGAALPYEQLLAAPDPVARADAFLTTAAAHLTP